MVALILLLTPCGNPQSLNDPTQEHRVVRIEVNTCYGQNGKVRYQQIIFWDGAYGGIRCVAYRMVHDNGTKYTVRSRSIAWTETGVKYVVRGLVHHTVTPVCMDPEVLDREFLSTSHRGSMF